MSRHRLSHRGKGSGFWSFFGNLFLGTDFPPPGLHLICVPNLSLCPPKLLWVSFSSSIRRGPVVRTPLPQTDQGTVNTRPGNVVSSDKSIDFAPRHPPPVSYSLVTTFPTGQYPLGEVYPLGSSKYMHTESDKRRRYCYGVWSIKYFFSKKPSTKTSDVSGRRTAVVDHTGTNDTRRYRLSPSRSLTCVLSSENIVSVRVLLSV